MVPKKHILKVNKDSLIMIKRGYEAKTMLLKEVKPKKKTVVLNSRDKIFSLDSGKRLNPLLRGLNRSGLRIATGSHYKGEE